MAKLSLPPPSRIAVGSVTVNGQSLEVLLNPEWARYFESLNTQSNTTTAAVGLPGAPGATGAAGAAVSFVNSDSESSMEFIPGPRGEQGPRGDAAALFMLQEQPEAEAAPGQPTQLNEAFIAPTLLNSWVDYDATVLNATGYYKDSAGVVHLRGTVKSGVVGAAIFTLPAGYRPMRNEICAVIANGALGRLDVNSSGDVTLLIGANPYVSMDGITFRAANTY